MSTSPLIRLELHILDNPDIPYRFESFLNIPEEDLANDSTQLTEQDQLYLTSYGDDLDFRFTKIIPHDKQQWQQLDELTLGQEITYLRFLQRNGILIWPRLRL